MFIVKTFPVVIDYTYSLSRTPPPSSGSSPDAGPVDTVLVGGWGPPTLS